MPRARSPARDKAFEIYKEHNGNITNRKIAEMLDVSEKTVGGWKSKDNWDKKLVKELEESNGVLQTNERSTPNDKPTKRKGNRNPVINEKDVFQNGNSVAKKHGLFSRYMPAETLAIIEEFGQKSPKDLLWNQIQIQYAAIIRAQKIMYVKDDSDHLKLKIRETAMSNEYQISSAGDRYATFLTAQSRAISELRTSINHYNKIADEDDERRLKLEAMQLDVDRKKEELKILKDEDEDGNETVIKSFLVATTPSAEDMAKLFGDSDGDQDGET